MSWTKEQIAKSVFNFGNSDKQTQEKIAEFLQNNISFDEYSRQVAKKEKAIANMKNAKNSLTGIGVKYPQHLDFSQVAVDLQDMKNCAFLIMAGGEGERLRVSLKEKGYSDDDLKDFTKATFPIPNTAYKFGALEVNLRLIAKINCEIPVILTTGPVGSDTQILIPKILKENANFGVKNLEIIAQNERLHLTSDNKIVFENGKPITNPDETGGPIAKLKESGILENLEKKGVQKIIVLQGTAVYSKEILPIIASAGKNFDGMGIGIQRENFPEKDPYGTFVLAGENLRIIEKEVRTPDTYNIKNESGKYLPYNTGFYAFDINLLKNIVLPDYATPPKIILSEIEPSPKVGYAATDIIAFAKKPAVLTISNDDFCVIKNADDIDVLGEFCGKKI
ncbi:MAG: hypothetical protein FWE23_02545 [Chitinivibrionia bacterium]|nr:hypothetical protein [Chitinivibrionia bacterium]